MENTPYAELKSYSKQYGTGRKKITACDGVTLSFSAGSVTGLLGPNGAGKTTLIKGLCGLLYPTSGTVIVNGEENLNGRIGFVPDTPDLDYSLTVKETLYQCAKIHNLSEQQAEQTISKAVAYTQLQDVLYKRVGTLSKGFLQRTSFAKALSFNPSVLVFDEFSDGPDPAQIVHMRQVILSLAKEKAVLLSTHHIDEAESLCKNVYIIAHGKIVSSGSIQEILAQTKARNLEQAFLKLTQEVDSCKAENGL